MNARHSERYISNTSSLFEREISYLSAFIRGQYILQKQTIPILKQICSDCDLVYHPRTFLPVKTDLEAVCPEFKLTSVCVPEGTAWTLVSSGT